MRFIVLGCALSVSLLAAGLVSAQIKKGKSRPAKTAQLMKGVVKSNCDALKKGLEAAPANDEGWDALGLHAALMNEASYLLMDDGRCPDSVWAEAASKTMRQGSADLMKAVDAKDFAGAKAAFGAMTKSCKACHDAHKEKK